MKESKTTYSYLIEHMEDPSFEKVWDIAFDFVQKLPSELCDELHDSLNRGIDILDSEPLLQMYIYSFGMMHNAKLQYAFNNVQKPVINYEEVEIVDYGCGQGLASICYHDFIIEHNCDQRVRRITLIEPSEMALSRAELLCSRFYPDAEIIAINKQFDDLTNDDLILSSDIPTIHLLSNILDVESYDLPHLSRLVKEQSVGDNEYVLVSPMQNSQRLERLRTFSSSIDKVVYFEQYLEKRQLDEDKDWTCAVLLCSNSLKLDSEKVFEEASAFHNQKDKDLRSEYCAELFYKLKICADQGDKKCQNQLGIWYERGIGVEPDNALAFEWYKKSAEQGYASAFGNIGRCYLEGKGIRKDTKKAVEYFSMGAELNHSSCLFKLGNCYYEGVGVEKDYKKAFCCFKESAKGDAKKIACFYLYLCYINGLGTDKDEKSAIKSLRQSANLNHRQSCYLMAKYYEDGKHVEKDERKAFSLYKKSAELGYRKAQERLGEIYRSGLLDEEKNPKKAFRWYNKAAEEGSSTAQFYVGWFYDNGYGIKKDETLAFEWYLRAAEQNNASALNNLAVCYEKGEGTSIDLTKAISCYERAAKLGSLRAKKNLANCYKKGIGVTPDAERYFYWILEAAKNNDLESIGKVAFYYFIGYGTEKNNENALLWYARYYSKSNNYDSQINDIDDAFSFFEQRAEIGDAQALYIMGKCAQYGIKIEKDFEIAHIYFEKAAELGHIESLIKIRESLRLINLCSTKKEDTSVVEVSGITYSSDKKILIKGGYQRSKVLKIPFGTRVICNGAFYGDIFSKIIIPSSVLFIGKNPFGINNYFGSKGIENIECYSANYIVLDHALYSRDKKKLISYFGTDSKFAVPLGVEIIGEKAFAENDFITEIKFPSTLRTIEKEAFQYCLKLNRVTIPESVISIGINTFYGCESLCEVHLNGKMDCIPSGAFMGCRISRLVLPETLVEIADNAFHSNDELKEVVLPNSVKRIGKSCFAYCNLKRIFLSGDLQEIGDFCFYGCQIDSIIIPSQVKTIGLNPFIGTSQIECLNNKIFTSENGLLYDKVNGELIAHFEEEEIALFPPIRKVKSFAFYGSKVKDILVGKNIVELEPWAFYEARKLERIRWQKCTIKEISVGCFGDCNSIERIEIPKTVEKVEAGSFFNCYSLNTMRFEGESSRASSSIFYREDRPDILPNLYWPRHQLLGSMDEGSERKNIDVSTFKKIEILIPYGCAEQYSFEPIYDYSDGDFRTYGMDRNFIIKEYEQ